ncbi:hypothetical protein [Microbacterium gubbeenense]|uniref:hypothetical protein n=1 Tax=Microbacterium TaxID=33882 RepID=UPI003F957D2D
MGSNRRYPSLGEDRREERELRDATAKGPLQSLTPEQLALTRLPITVAPPRTPITGTAWLRFGDTDVQATVRIDRWTERAVGVELELNGKQLRCWVWRGAVTFNG